MVNARYPSFLNTLEEIVTTDRIIETLMLIADTPAPSQTASATRGRVIEELARHRGLLASGGQYVPDAFGSGGDLLEAGTGGVRFITHIDEISYVLAGASSDGRWPLVAYCYHLADGKRPAAVIRHSDVDGYQIFSKGVVDEFESQLFYQTEDRVLLEGGDRIILRSPVAVDQNSGRVTGSLDNAAGVASALVAAEVLSVLGIPYSLVLPDEEEGPAGKASQTISRGSTRLLRHLSSAPLTVVTDIHGLSPRDLADTDWHQTAWGVSFPEYSSSTRGSVTPPPLYRGLRGYFGSLAQECDLRVKPNRGGYTPRSDDVVAMMHSPMICLLGFPGSNRHFDAGLPTANVKDLAALAKALAAVGAATGANAVSGMR